MRRPLFTLPCIAVVVVLGLALAAMGWRFIVAGDTGPVEDGRTTIRLTPGERTLVLREMRGFVDGTRLVLEAALRNDMPAVAKAAQDLGLSRAHDAPPALFGRLPLEFKAMAMDLHRAFDQLAADAGTVGRPEHSLAQLARILERCSSCHAAWAFTALERP